MSKKQLDHHACIVSMRTVRSIGYGTYLSAGRSLRPFDKSSRKTARVHARNTSRTSTPRVAFLSLQTLHISNTSVELLCYSDQLSFVTN